MTDIGRVCECIVMSPCDINKRVMRRMGTKGPAVSVVCINND